MTPSFPDMAEANRRFGEVFLLLTQRSVDTNSLRRLTTIGLPHAEAHLFRQFRTFVEDLAAGPEFDTYFLDREMALRYFGGLNGMAEQMSSNQLDRYQWIVDSAALVFAHSAVDAAATELCWITALAEPDDWEQYVLGKEVSLSEVKTASFSALFHQKLSSYLEYFERESLLKRFDRLFALCRPPEEFEGISGFRFDRDRLHRLDRLRHDVVHHNVEQADFDDIEQDLDFIFKSGLHVWGMVHHRYGVQMDVRNLVDVPDFPEGSSD